jgi:hypothetical protein
MSLRKYWYEILLATAFVLITIESILIPLLKYNFSRYISKKKEIAKEKKIKIIEKKKKSIT